MEVMEHCWMGWSIYQKKHWTKWNIPNSLEFYSKVLSYG